MPELPWCHGDLKCLMRVGGCQAPTLSALAFQDESRPMIGAVGAEVKYIRYLVGAVEPKLFSVSVAYCWVPLRFEWDCQRL